ncbi:MAG: hypothetical protein K2Z81_02085, partial [Cyanobacteria bacterium]|nr:hypothetical protein [Cyanobacteriota bacterium]
MGVRFFSPLKEIKQPSNSQDSPSLKDYVRVLERFPALGERGWHANYKSDPDLGYFGDPDSGEMGMRSNGNFIFVMSLLASEPSYDPKVTTFTRGHLLKRARSCLAYMTRSHVTGDITCANEKKWGNTWQSSWWTTKMAIGAGLIWDQLSAKERASVRRVVEFEASRHLERKAVNGAVSNTHSTRSEENAWDSEVLATAVAMFPNHEKASAWRAKLIEFALNSLSAPEDANVDEP